MRRLLVGLTALMALLGMFPESIAQELTPTARARALLLEGKIDDALRIVASQADAEPNNVRARAAVALLLAQAGREGDAQAIFVNAQQLARSADDTAVLNRVQRAFDELHALRKIGAEVTAALSDFRLEEARRLVANGSLKGDAKNILLYFLAAYELDIDDARTRIGGLTQHAVASKLAIDFLDRQARFERAQSVLDYFVQPQGKTHIEALVDMGFWAKDLPDSMDWTDPQGKTHGIMNRLHFDEEPDWSRDYMAAFRVNSPAGMRAASQHAVRAFAEALASSHEAAPFARRAHPARLVGAMMFLPFDEMRTIWNRILAAEPVLEMRLRGKCDEQKTGPTLRLSAEPNTIALVAKPGHCSDRRYRPFSVPASQIQEIRQTLKIDGRDVFVDDAALLVLRPVGKIPAVAGRWDQHFLEAAGLQAVEAAYAKAGMFFRDWAAPGQPTLKPLKAGVSTTSWMDTVTMVGGQVASLLGDETAASFYRSLESYSMERRAGGASTMKAASGWGSRFLSEAGGFLVVVQFDELQSLLETM